MRVSALARVRNPPLRSRREREPAGVADAADAGEGLYISGRPPHGVGLHCDAVTREAVKVAYELPAPHVHLGCKVGELSLLRAHAEAALVLEDGVAPELRRYLGALSLGEVPHLDGHAGPITWRSMMPLT